MKTPLSDEEIGLNWATDAARHSVRGGYGSREDAIYFVTSVIEDEGLTISAEEVVDAEISALINDQKSWPEISDFDKLVHVFEELEKDGIIALDNFSCCGTCGPGDITEFVKVSQQEHGYDDELKGYAFFHEQDTESAIDGNGVYLSYGNFPLRENESEAIKIGKSVAQRLREADFNVVWNETLQTRIHVSVKWQRPWVESPS